jgi:MFS family permease/quinol monooxygenase YgiN
VLTSSEESSPPPPRPGSAWAPLAHPVFRMLWAVWLTANIGMWMNDVAAAWLMTTLTTSPIMVALVQSASTLPVFLLGLPSGALADILDRRRYFMVTQFWVAVVALVLCAAVLSDAMTPPVLLALTFANGIGLAMRWPVFAAIVPELVPRMQLPAALALNAVAMNASRIAGPIIAGALIAGAGSAYVFVLNALMSVGAGMAIMRWKHEQKASSLPGERFLGAIRVGVQYVNQSARMHTVLLRVSVFFVQSTALLALLPLVARQLHQGNAATYTVLLASMGGGAIVAAMFLPRLRDAMSRDSLVRNGTLLQTAAMVVVSFAPNSFVAAPAMVVAGMAWISVANSISVSAQLGLPDWVRARGMSIFQMAIMGSSAFGAALWGQVATLTTVSTSLQLGAASGILAMLLTRRFKLDAVADEDLSPAHAWKPPVSVVPIDPHEGPVMVTIDYRIDPAKAAEFQQVMQESRRSRLRHGALSWELFRDTSDPGRYIEYFIDESWVEHLRRFDRVTAGDVALRERRFAFHIGDGPPVVSRYIAEPLSHR